MKQLDPRTLMVLTACLSSLLLTVNRLPWLAGIVITAALCSHLAGRLARMKLPLAALAPIFLFIAVAQSIIHGRGPGWLHVGKIVLLSPFGLQEAVRFMLRLYGILFCAALLASCSSRRIIQALIQLKLPYEIAFMASLALRFLPSIRDQARDTLNALRLRGIVLRQVPARHYLRLLGCFCAPLLLNALLSAKQLATAMEMRAFRLHARRTFFHRLRLGVRDYCIMSASVAAVVMLAMLYRVTG